MLALSRLDEVDSPDLDSAITYLPGTDTLQGIAVTRGGNVIHSRSLAIDLLGRTVGVTNKAGASAGSLVTVASVGHAYDAAGRRENARREDGTWWDYDYNSRSEVTAAVKKTAADAAVPGLSYSYGYDGIGNRTSSASGTGAGVASRSYVADALNKYDSITHNGKLGILTRSDAAVTATANAGVTVNGVDPEGNLHGIRLTATNGTTGKLATATVKRAGVTVGTASAWVPPATVVPSYDLDGNLLTDGRWTYTWDGESRLVSMLPLATALTGGAPNIELKFAYDWQGRRIGKTVVDKTSGTAVNSHMSYAYDHWNPVAEWKRTSLTGSLAGTALQRTHLWGPDIASSGKAPAKAKPDFQAAGGVAGLVATTHHNGAGAKDHFIPGYDANGNIIAWTDGSGTLLQRMDYDPFGNAVLVEKTGTSTLVAKLPPFGFSTKPQDAETGLLYYGYRYYDPVTGRWPSRDPIEEQGGANLYGFVGNGAVDRHDYLGQLWEKYRGPAKRDDKLFPGQRGGETEGDWTAPRIEGPSKAGRCMKLVLKGKFSVTIRLNTLPGSLNFVDRLGNTPLVHEQVHEQIHQKWFNHSVDSVNPLEGYYCNNECAILAKDWGYAVLRLHNARANEANAAFDNYAYNAGREGEQAQWAAEAARQSRRINELKGKLNAKNCAVYDKCPL